MENELPNAAERVLAEALTQYSNAEPLAGIEERVMRRIHTRRRWIRYAWWGSPVAATLVLVAVLWPRRAPQELTLRVDAPRPPQIAVVAEVPHRHAVRLPKRQVFPTPTPLRSEERAWLAFVALAPEAARNMSQERDRPIQIEELNIAPLENAELKGN